MGHGGPCFLVKLDPFLYDLLNVCMLIQVDYPLLLVSCDLDLEELFCGSIVGDLPFVNDHSLHLINLISLW